MNKIEAKEENIVKRTCKELGITQKELAEMLEVPQSTLSGWVTGDIPKMTEKALVYMLEIKELKEKFEILKKAHRILSE